jgi:hypothetical protein
MTTGTENIAEMEMPCKCDCGEFFDLNDGNTCGECERVFCTECVDEPFGLCYQCAGREDKRLERELEGMEWTEW